MLNDVSQISTHRVLEMQGVVLLPRFCLLFRCLPMGSIALSESCIALSLVAGLELCSCPSIALSLPHPNIYTHSGLNVRSPLIFGSRYTIFESFCVTLTHISQTVLISINHRSAVYVFEPQTAQQLVSIFSRQDIFRCRSGPYFPAGQH